MLTGHLSMSLFFYPDVSLYLYFSNLLFLYLSVFIYLSFPVRLSFSFYSFSFISIKRILLFFPLGLSGSSIKHHISNESATLFRNSQVLWYLYAAIYQRFLDFENYCPILSFILKTFINTSSEIMLCYSFSWSSCIYNYNFVSKI